MSNAEEPKAGQWWLHSNGNVMFIAFDERTIGGTETIPILAYAEDLENSWHRPGEFVRRLPDDAGFDWKPEPEYPQYWTAYGEQYVYLRRVSCDTHRCVKRDGSESGDCDWHGIPHDGRKQLTKQEAEAKLDKPNRIPVRLYWYDGNVVARYDHTPPTDPSFIEIKLDSERHISDSGFYVEGSLSQQ